MNLYIFVLLNFKQKNKYQNLFSNLILRIFQNQKIILISLLINHKKFQKFCEIIDETPKKSSFIDFDIVLSGFSEMNYPSPLSLRSSCETTLKQIKTIIIYLFMFSK